MPILDVPHYQTTMATYNCCRSKARLVPDAIRRVEQRGFNTECLRLGNKLYSFTGSEADSENRIRRLKKSVQGSPILEPQERSATLRSVSHGKIVRGREI